MTSPISVVIPTYNGARFIEAALASIVAQTLLPHEILVVDDCSRDETPEIVQAFATRSPVPVRLRRLPTNSGGPTKPMNEGVRQSITPLVATLDQDDLMAPTRLASQFRVLEAHPAAPAVVGLLRMINGLDQSINPNFEEDSRKRILAIEHAVAPDCCLLAPASFYSHVLLRGTLTIASSTTFRRAAWEAIGGFPLGLRVAWDLDFSCKMSTQGPVAFLDEVVGSYRLHDGNTSAQGHHCARESLALKRLHFAQPLYPIDQERLRNDLARGYFDVGYEESVRGATLGPALQAAWRQPTPSASRPGT